MGNEIVCFGFARHSRSFVARVQSNLIFHAQPSFRISRTIFLVKFSTNRKILERSLFTWEVRITFRSRLTVSDNLSETFITLSDNGFSLYREFNVTYS